MVKWKEVWSLISTSFRNNVKTCIVLILVCVSENTLIKELFLLEINEFLVTVTLFAIIYLIKLN